eukprot:1143202-Pelagomonas_calceolata.AAC.9
MELNAEMLRNGGVRVVPPQTTVVSLDSKRGKTDPRELQPPSLRELDVPRTSGLRVVFRADPPPNRVSPSKMLSLKSRKARSGPVRESASSKSYSRPFTVGAQPGGMCNGVSVKSNHILLLPKLLAAQFKFFNAKH